MQLRLMKRTREHAVVVAEKASWVPNFLPDEGRVECLLDPANLIFEYEDKGVIAVMDIVPGIAAHVHLTFWDGRLKDKVEICKELARQIIDLFELQALFTAIPEGRDVLIAFAKRVGFQVAGVGDGNVQLILLHAATTNRVGG